MNKQIQWSYRLITLSVCIWLAFEPLAVAASAQTSRPAPLPVADSSAVSSAAAAEHAAAAPTAASTINTGAAPLTPAHAGAPLPTISLDRSAGYAGQMVTVSGRGVAPYPGVRVAWLTGDASLTAAVVSTRPDGSYQATVPAPVAAEPGPAEICAAVTQAEFAEFACADFMITAPPPGSVHGQLPLEAGGAQGASPGVLNATVSLVNSAGKLAASAPIDGLGKFEVPAVTAGNYTVIVAGETPFPVDVTNITVAPDEDVEVNFVPGRDIFCTNSPPDVMVGDVTATPNGLPYGSKRFGAYLSLPGSSVRLDVTFTAEYLQVKEGMKLGGIAFELTGPGTNLVLSDRPSQTQARYNVSQLSPGEYNLRVRAWAAEGNCQSVIERTIVVIPNPLNGPYLTRRQLTWNSAEQAYNFSASMLQPGTAGVP